ncbi:hypothetical protein [Staphylococcus sp. GDB20D115P1]|jgi:hypothetical protein|uniref:hypothetical protein n=1 Tax=Staphylococcus sp. GDB20D115P1 TaxID=2804085 RepID=UPI001AEC33FE|nr:hypothetical protein [Staphylococcus sp. GDB20D115P1]HJG40246.1 hypothetical protein [Staphylococcus saprophyticus]
MNKSFLIALAMFIVTTILISMISDAIAGFGLGWILGLATFVFFEFVYYDDEKKTAKRANA